MIIRNTNAMDVIKSKKGSNFYLTYKIIGGILSFRAIVTTEKYFESLQYQIMDNLGVSHLPPFWSLGFHQSRFGYQNVSAI